MLSDYFLPSSGGVERAIFEVSRRLVRAGQNVTVLTLATTDAPRREVMDGVDVLRSPGLDLSGQLGAQVAVSPHVWFALRQQLNQARFDIVHTHTLFFHVSLAASVLAGLARVPLVTTAHLGSPEDLGGAVGKATSVYERTFGRRVLNASHRVIAVSQSVATHISPLMKDPARLRVIPNGVDLERFTPNREPNNQGAATVVFVGRLIFNKGPQALLDAVPQVLSRFPQTRFQFVGDGPMRADLERKAAQRKLADQVEFMGQREDVAGLLGKASVFCRPSLSEGLPLTALEAMACGLPVVATRAGGTAEVVEDGITGYIVAPNHPAEVADRLCRLLTDDSLRAEMGRRGRKAAEQYDWTSVTERTLDVYRETVQG
jgi:glycosyltransferase involved in cell wall biosynthesis